MTLHLKSSRERSCKITTQADKIISLLPLQPDFEQGADEAGYGLRVYPSLCRPDLVDLAPTRGLTVHMRCTLPSKVGRREAERLGPACYSGKGCLDEYCITASSNVLIVLQYSLEPRLDSIALLLQPKMRPPFSRTLQEFASYAQAGRGARYWSVPDRRSYIELISSDHSCIRARYESVVKGRIEW